MKELSINKKETVIRLFLEGYPYGEISKQTGVSKGSVANIVDDFREGNIPIPPVMAEYVDSLRSLVVDLRKNSTNVSAVKSYLVIHSKLNKMGVTADQMERSLDMVQQISTPSTSNSQFIWSALELAKKTSDTGLSYGDLLADYDAKTKTVKSLGRKVRAADGSLTRAKQERTKAKRELQGITKKTIAAKKAFDRKRTRLESVQKQYMKQHNLSWRRIRLMEAVVATGFKSASLSVRAREKIEKQITTAGSVVRAIQLLRRTEAHIQAQVDELVVHEQQCALKINELKHIENQLDISISGKEAQETEFGKELESRTQEKVAVDREISDKTEDLRISSLVLDFLRSSKGISDSGLDQLVSMLITLRQYRLGIGPKQVTDGTGKLVCQCPVPAITTNFGTTKADMDDARGTLAHYLTPLVQDKFVLKFDHDLAVMRHGITEQLAYLKGIVEESNR